jgi:hypothetical protein
MTAATDSQSRQVLDFAHVLREGGKDPKNININRPNDTIVMAGHHLIATNLTIRAKSLIVAEATDNKESYVSAHTFTLITTAPSIVLNVHADYVDVAAPELYHNVVKEPYAFLSKHTIPISCGVDKVEQIALQAGITKEQCAQYFPKALAEAAKQSKVAGSANDSKTNK